LSFASKLEIRNFAEKENIKFRLDQSNFEDKYLRNNLRNRILPLFEEAQPSFSETMVKNMGRIQQAIDALDFSIEVIKKKYVIENDEEISISKNLFKEKGHEFFLHALIGNFGFTESQIDNILNGGQVGNKFVTNEAILYIERDSLVLKKSIEEINTEELFRITEKFDTKNLPIKMDFFVDGIENFSLDKNVNVALLDFEKINFPLTLRRWNDGDKFKPLGMQGKKLVSSFLTHEKVKSYEKKDQWVLLSDDEILWVVGHRISDDFKISKKTKKFLKILCHE